MLSCVRSSYDHLKTKKTLGTSNVVHWLILCAFKAQGKGFDPWLGRSGEKPGGATPCPRSGEAAERSYPVSEVRGSGPECQAATTQEQPRGAPQCQRPGAVTRSYPTLEVRGSRREELPHVQGVVACEGAGRPGATPHSRSRGAAVKRYPSSKVRSSSCALLEQL